MQLLYENAKIKVIINDHTNSTLFVRFEVRQDDFINCSLFVTMIEYFFIYINQCTSIQETQIDDEIIKLMMYANDTTITHYR